MCCKYVCIYVASYIHAPQLTWQFNQSKLSPLAHNLTKKSEHLQIRTFVVSPNVSYPYYTACPFCLKTSSTVCT